LPLEELLEIIQFLKKNGHIGSWTMVEAIEEILPNQRLNNQGAGTVYEVF